MKPIHFDVEEDGFYGTYWACKDTHTAADTNSIETVPAILYYIFYRTSVLFPLDGRGRLGRNVVAYAVGARDLGNDAAGDAGQDVVG